MLATATTVMENHLTVPSGTPASDSPSRATPATAMTVRKTFWNAKYSEKRLPNTLPVVLKRSLLIGTPASKFLSPLGIVVPPCDWFGAGFPGGSDRLNPGSTDPSNEAPRHRHDERLFLAALSYSGWSGRNRIRRRLRHTAALASRLPLLLHLSAQALLLLLEFG